LSFQRIVENQQEQRRTVKTSDRSDRCSFVTGGIIGAQLDDLQNPPTRMRTWWRSSLGISAAEGSSRSLAIGGGRDLRSRAHVRVSRAIALRIRSAADVKGVPGKAWMPRGYDLTAAPLGRFVAGRRLTQPPTNQRIVRRADSEFACKHMYFSFWPILPRLCTAPQARTFVQGAPKSLGARSESVVVSRCSRRISACAHSTRDQCAKDRTRYIRWHARDHADMN